MNSTENGPNQIESPIPSQQSDPEITRYIERLKTIIPLLILLIVKIIADYSITFLFIAVVSSSLFKVRYNLDLQVSLKRQSNGLIFIYLLHTCMALNLFLVVFLHFTDSVTKTFQPLINEGVAHQYHQSFFETIWSCWVVDTLVELVSLQIKTIFCIYIGSKSLLFHPGSFKIICNIDHFCDFLRGIHTGSAVSTQQQRMHSNQRDDLESNNSNSMNQNILPQALASTVIHPQVDAYVASHFVSIQGLARRFVSSSSSISSNQSATTTSTNNHAHVPIASQINNSLTDTEDSKRDDMALEPASVYLNKLRIFAMIDITSYIARTLLPFPFWYAYLRGGKFGPALTIIYTSFKMIDVLSWKIPSYLVALEFFIWNKLEFGHYTTPEEISQRQQTDCPICYDSPQKAITLDCSHVFCEVCISEWLNKEKTCPVCRAEVKPVSTALSNIKQEAKEAIPVLMWF